MDIYKYIYIYTYIYIYIYMYVNIYVFNMYILHITPMYYVYTCIYICMYVGGRTVARASSKRRNSSSGIAPAILRTCSRV